MPSTKRTNRVTVELSDKEMATLDYNTELHESESRSAFVRSLLRDCVDPPTPGWLKKWRRRRAASRA